MGDRRQPVRKARYARHAVLLRAVLHFAVRLVVAIVVAVVVGVVWSLAHGGPLHHTLEAGFYVVGALSLLVGAVGVGGMSPSSTMTNTVGRIPGIRVGYRAELPPNTLSLQAILFMTGAVLIGLGVLLQLY